MKPKILILLISLGIVAILAAGCSSSSPANTQVPTPAISTVMPSPAQTQPGPTVSATAVLAAPAGNAVQLTLTSQNIQFDKKTLAAPAGRHVVLTFVNNDAGVPHNFALYSDSSATKKIFIGEFITGTKTTTYEFDAPSTPGNYFFRCDLHPSIMYGTFEVT